MCTSCRDYYKCPHSYSGEGCTHITSRQVCCAPSVVIHAAAADQAPVSPRSLLQRWHAQAWRPPQSALWGFQCAVWHLGLQ